MENINFQSGEITSASYDDITRELYVRHSNGEYYVYYEVIPIDYVGFLSTDNHSQYVKDRIDMKYPKRKLH